MPENDVIFKLKFQTDQAVVALSTLSKKLSNSLQKSLKLPSGLGNITKIMDLENAKKQLEKINLKLAEIKRFKGGRDVGPEVAKQAAQLLQQRENLLVSTSRLEKKHADKDILAERLYKSNKTLLADPTGTKPGLGDKGVRREDFNEGSVYREKRRVAAEELAKSIRLDARVKTGERFKAAKEAGTLEKLIAPMGTKGETTLDINAFIRAERAQRRAQNLKAQRVPSAPRQEAKKGLGITKAAENLLAWSSVVAPIAPQVGGAMMGAGFAAFTKHPVMAVLALSASALASIARGTKTLVENSRKSGLETVDYSGATIELKTRMSLLGNIVGVKIQQALIPVIDKLVDLFDVFEKLPWDDLVGRGADFLVSTLNLADILTTVPQAIAKNSDQLGSMFNQIIRTAMWSDDPEHQKKREERTGTQKVDYWRMFQTTFALGPGHAIFGGDKGVLGGGVFGEEWRQRNEPDKNKEGIDFVHTPKFAFRKIDQVGKGIQAGIMREAGKTPLERATDISNAILRKILTATKDGKAGGEQMSPDEIIEKIMPMIRGGLIN